MLNRAIRAALLRGGLYHELTDEPEEIFYALAIVVLSGITLGAGTQYVQLPKWEGASIWLFVFFSVWARIVGWFLWAGIAYIVGTKAFGGQAGYRRLLRSIGLTYTPGVLALFGGIPVVGPFLLGLSFLWIFPGRAGCHPGDAEVELGAGDYMRHSGMERECGAAYSDISAHSG